MSVLGVVAVTPDGVRCVDPDIRVERYGVRVRQTSDAVELSRDHAAMGNVYFRAGYGRLEWGDDLAAFSAHPARADLDAGALLALVHGVAQPPDTTLLPGVRRLPLAGRIRVDASGIRTGIGSLALPAAAAGLAEAVGEALATAGPHTAIAYSGGLSSAYLAVWRGLPVSGRS